MIDQYDAATVRALDAWRPPGAEPDWADVLRRARVRSSRPVTGRVVGMLAAAVLATALLTPGFGLGGRLRDLISGSRGPGLLLSAQLVQGDGSRAGILSLRATGDVFVTAHGHRRRVVRPHFYSRRRPHPLVTTTFTWNLSLPGSALDARIQRTSSTGTRKVAARLCHPCSSKESGSLQLARNAVGALFSDQAVAIVTTDAGTARGVIRLGFPRRQ